MTMDVMKYAIDRISSTKRKIGKPKKEEELKDFVKNGFKPGFQIGLENFDDIFSTYTGQFITVTGVPSSGKSDFVDQMAVGYRLF